MLITAGVTSLRPVLANYALLHCTMGAVALDINLGTSQTLSRVRLVLGILVRISLL